MLKIKDVVQGSRALATAMLALAATISPAAAVQPQEVKKESGLEAKRAELLSIAGQVAAATPRLAKLWEGFWPTNQSFIIYAPEAGSLLISDRPAPGFEPLASEGLPPQLRERAFFRAGSVPEFTRPFDIAYPLSDGRTSILVQLSPRLNSAEVPRVLVHEQFHAFQSHAFKGRRFGQFIAPDAITDRATFAATAELERRILAAAAAAPSAGETKRLLRQYLAVRREREASMPPGVVMVEREFERTEGTARYTEYLASTIFEPTLTVQKRLITDLSQELGTDIAFTTAWFRSRSYGNGAALAYFLNRLNAKDWKRNVETGTPLDRQLEAVVDFASVKGSAMLAKTARERLGYDVIRADLGPKILAAAKNEIKNVQEFYALAPHRVVFEFKDSIDAKQRPKVGLATGPKGMALLSVSENALPLADLVNVQTDGASLTIKKRPVLLGGGGKGKARYVALLGAPPVVNGMLADKGLEQRFESGTVTAEGFDLRIEHPFKVIATEHETVVSLIDRADAG